jgi:FtsH-binding integral membrane protein
MKQNIGVLIPLIIMLIITYISAFDKHGKPKCDNYILNCYLYAVTYLFMMLWFIVLLMENKFDILKKFSRGVALGIIIGLVIASFVLYLGILYLNKDMIIVKHLLSVAFIGVSSVLLHMIFQYFEVKSIVFAAVMAVILFLILTGFAWKFQDMISSKLSMTFFIIFIIFIILEMIVGIFMPFSILDKVIIGIVLLLICYLLLVHTKKMIENSQTCIEDKGPDYVKESMGLVVIFKNILIRLLELFGKAKKQR